MRHHLADSIHFYGLKDDITDFAADHKRWNVRAEIELTAGFAWGRAENQFTKLNFSKKTDETLDEGMSESDGIVTLCI
jgi:hypothetical protein